MINVTEIAKDKLLHFSVMAVFAALVYVIAAATGSDRPVVCTLFSALILAIGWEAYHKFNGGTNTKREMALDIAAGMAGAIIVVVPVFFTSLS